MTFIPVAAAFILLFSHPVTVMAGAGEPSLEEYRYQRALYSSLTGDYFSSVRLGSGLMDSPLRERALLPLRLSDINLMYKRDYPEPVVQLKGSPLEHGLLDSLYRMKEYEATLSLARMYDSGAARYIEGMSLLGLDRLEESRLSLTRVVPSSRFYPYARIALAQISVMKKDLRGAEGYLKGILPHLPAGEDGLADRVHILLGQVSFERGLYPDAVKEFSQVPQGSPVYMEAAMGRAWGLLMQGDCEGAISILKGTELRPTYDAIEQEASMVMGQCYTKTGLLREAREHYQGLLSAVSATEEALGKTIADESARRRYISTLLGKPLSLTDEERYFLSIMEGDPAVSAIAREYEVLSEMKTAFLGKGREVAEKAAYIENRMDGLAERLARMERGVEEMKGILREIRRRERQPVHIERERFGIDITYFSDMLFNYWGGILGRDVSAETKMLVLLIMQDWIRERSPECLRPYYICHILNFANPMGVVSESSEQVLEIIGIMETVGGDLADMRRTEKTRFDSMLPKVRERVSNEIYKNRRTMKMLGGMRKRVEKDMEEIERGLEETLAALDRRIVNRFTKAGYELADFKVHIMSGLDAARGDKTR